jgi:hypothetical protein
MDGGAKSYAQYTDSKQHMNHCISQNVTGMAYQMPPQALAWSRIQSCLTQLVWPYTAYPLESVAELYHQRLFATASLGDS